MAIYKHKCAKQQEHLLENYYVELNNKIIIKNSKSKHKALYLA